MKDSMLTTTELKSVIEYLKRQQMIHLGKKKVRTLGDWHIFKEKLKNHHDSEELGTLMMLLNDQVEEHKNFAPKQIMVTLLSSTVISFVMAWFVFSAGYMNSFLGIIIKYYIDTKIKADPQHLVDTALSDGTQIYKETYEQIISGITMPVLYSLIVIFLSCFTLVNLQNRKLKSANFYKAIIEQCIKETDR
ncbi:hypothetical protein [Priestia koreensis]|uniref:hypothetical protein n=1 Tax=Priestia koreensis TaxID=284581 RepID=UPI00301A5379